MADKARIQKDHQRADGLVHGRKIKITYDALDYTGFTAADSFSQGLFGRPAKLADGGFVKNIGIMQMGGIVGVGVGGQV